MFFLCFGCSDDPGCSIESGPLYTSIYSAGQKRELARLTLFLNIFVYVCFHKQYHTISITFIQGSINPAMLFEFRLATWSIACGWAIKARAFTLVAKWGNLPKWHICNICYSGDKIPILNTFCKCTYMLLYVTINHPSDIHTIYATPASYTIYAVTYMGYIWV